MGTTSASTQASCKAILSRAKAKRTATDATVMTTYVR